MPLSFSQNPFTKDGDTVKQVISLLMVSPFLIYFAFQPVINHVAHLETMVLELVMNEGIQKASVDGRFTDQNIAYMKQIIMDNLHFPEDEITFEGTQNLTSRGNRLWGRISVPDGKLSIMPRLFWSNPTIKFSAYASQMSEYVVR